MIDMGRVIDLIEQAEQEAEALNATPWDDAKDFDGGKPMGRAERAEISRRLLRLSDLLAQAASEVREQYWAGKGYPS